MTTKRVKGNLDRGTAFGDVIVTARVPQGKRFLDVEVEIDADEHVRLAECITGCQQVFTDKATGETAPDMRHVAFAPDRYTMTWIGHAFWHLRNPDRIMPCLPHGTKVIDVEDRPLLEEPKR